MSRPIPKQPQRPTKRQMPPAKKPTSNGHSTLDAQGTINTFLADVTRAAEACEGNMTSLAVRVGALAGKYKADGRPKLVGKSFVDFEPPPPNDPNTLLGNRWVCRGGSGTITGSTGLGKSVLAMQLGLAWSLGRELFGIKPSGPLKIVCIQAENDDGDIGEMTAGALAFFKLSKQEMELARKNFIVVTESARTSNEFVEAVLRPLIEKHKPDLIILDPALAYVGGDASAQEVVSDFLRNQLNPLLQQHRCAVFVVCHTAKPATRDGANPKGGVTDHAYAVFGSAEWSNWSRAMLNFSADAEDPTICTLRIAKRFRLGWTDEQGNRVYQKTLRQNRDDDGLLYFVEMTDDEANGERSRQRLPTADDIRSVLMSAERLLSRDEWWRATNHGGRFKEIGLPTFKTRIEALIAEGRVEREGAAQKCRYRVTQAPAPVPRKTIASAFKARQAKVG